MKDINLETTEIMVPRVTLPLEMPHAFSSRVDVQFGAVSDAGKKRDNNEDAYLIFRTGRFWERISTSLRDGDLPNRFDENAYAMIVADGMGGVEGGELASSMALRVCVNLILNAPQWALKLDNPENREEELQLAKERAEEYIRKADEFLNEYAQAYPRFKGMGTTLTSIYSYADDAFVIHIGDSRAYLFRDGSLQRLTRDHTVAQMLADIGDIQEGEIATHRFRHVLTSALGGREGKIVLDIHQFRIHHGDRLLLCTDGLNDMVKDDAIAETMSSSDTPQKVCDSLLQMALDQGGHDNVTIIVADYTIPTKIG